MRLAVHGYFWVSKRAAERGTLLIRCIDELMKDEHASRVAEAEISQALSTAIQIALVDLFQWLGVAPSVVVGHSSGEIAAA